MGGTSARILALAAAALALAGCAGSQAIATLPAEPGRSLALADRHRPEQCAPYAREHSDVKIYGDAWTWWDQASGHYPRGDRPRPGSVMMLDGYAGPERAHLAVVRTVVSTREIRVDHANWLDDGAIYLDDPVADVSGANDWSLIKVWNIKTGAWGGRVYPVKGFIGGSPTGNDRIARADMPE